MQGPEAAEGFEWDDELLEHGNTAHLAESRSGRPSIAWFEAEEVFYNGGILVPNKRNKSGDWLMVGRTDAGRRLTLVVHWDKCRRIIWVITGWNSTQGERARYAGDQGGGQ
jgi:uncharacterized DUF497 family protein